MGWPQYIYLVLAGISVVNAAANFGEWKKPDRYDHVDVWIGPALSAALLWWGGFFG